MNGTTPAGLEQRVTNAIHGYERRRARGLLVFWCAATLCAAAAAADSSVNVAHAFSSSNFMHYAGLFYSDIDLMKLYWKELAVALVDALPLPSVIFALAASLAFLGSLRALAGIALDRFASVRA